MHTLTQYEIETAIWQAAGEAGRQYWDGASARVRGEIRDVYYDRGLAAAVQLLDDLARPERLPCSP